MLQRALDCMVEEDHSNDEHSQLEGVVVSLQDSEAQRASFRRHSFEGRE